MGIQIKTINKTDYIPDAIETINFNTLLFEEKIKEIYDGLNLDSEKKTIEIKHTVSSGVTVKDGGGVYFYSNETTPKLVGSIEIDSETNTSIAEFDKIKTNSIETNSSVITKNIVEKLIDSDHQTIVFNSSESDYIINTTDIGETTPDVINIELSFDGCLHNQVINLIFGSLNERTIQSIIIPEGDYEFANKYTDNDTKSYDISDISPNDYENQISFLVQKPGNKIIVLK